VAPNSTHVIESRTDKPTDKSPTRSVAFGCFRAFSAVRECLCRVQKLDTLERTKAPDVLALHGVSSFDVYPFSSKGLPGARAWWKKLERAFIIAFLEEYGEAPKLNVQGKKFRRTNEFELFSEDVIKHAIRDFEQRTSRRWG